MINEKHGQTHSTKMGADKWAENTPNASKFICQNCLSKHKFLGFRWKKTSLGVHSPWVCQTSRAIPVLTSKLMLSCHRTKKTFFSVPIVMLCFLYRNNDWLMKNMDKGIVKRLHWASVVRGYTDVFCCWSFWGWLWLC